RVVGPRADLDLDPRHEVAALVEEPAVRAPRQRVPAQRGSPGCLDAQLAVVLEPDVGVDSERVAAAQRVLHRVRGLIDTSFHDKGRPTEQHHDLLVARETPLSPTALSSFAPD